MAHHKKDEHMPFHIHSDIDTFQKHCPAIVRPPTVSSAGVFLVLPVVALVLAVRAMAVARRSGSTADFSRRISEMETQISVLRRTVRKLSGAGSVAEGA